MSDGQLEDDEGERGAVNRPLDHAERMALIMRPFRIETIGRSARWGGVTIHDGIVDLWDRRDEGKEEERQQNTATACGFQIETVTDAA